MERQRRRNSARNWKITVLPSGRILWRFEAIAIGGPERGGDQIKATPSSCPGGYPLGALASPYVKRETRLARQEGKTVSAVKGPELGDLSKLPRWLGHTAISKSPNSARD